MVAYLVIRDGAKWSDVFRLIPGRTVTIGRAPTNQIVVRDERASRCHAEVFNSGGSWTLRDLDSRNGTGVDGDRIYGDRTLEPGNIINIAHTQLAFVHDLSKAFNEGAVKRDEAEETVVTRILDEHERESDDPNEDSGVLEGDQPTRITHRRSQTSLLDVQDVEDEHAAPRVGRAAKKLCRLAFDLANQSDVASVSRLALDTLFSATNIDAGAVLLVSNKGPKDSPVDRLKTIVSRSSGQSAYYHISAFLAETVLREGEAVLARNVEDDSRLASRDSEGVINATSVVCAPVRQNRKVVGLIHIYSTNVDRQPDADDLEFTLAVADNLALALRNLSRAQELAANLSQSQSELLELRKQLGVESEIVGASEQVRQLHQEIGRAAPSRATVLIRGESGVGKELVARAIHFSSQRKDGPFVCLNCAALSETLLESELFGHEKGAFTGATERKIGKFEAAHGGTLMLDEIGEMTSTIQAKFLRVLEGHPFERVGGREAIKTDVRVIAATNRNLEKAVTQNKFRRDLYFRLNVVEIHVPPLRKRPQDILELANHFLKRFASEMNRKITGFTPQAAEIMEQYRWPGNIRELKNAVERAVVQARGEQIGPGDLVLSNLRTASESGELAVRPQTYLPMSLAEMEREHIQATLAANDWNKSRSAQILGIERSTLDRKIRRYKIRRDEG